MPRLTEEERRLRRFQGFCLKRLRLKAGMNTASAMNNEAMLRRGRFLDARFSDWEAGRSRIVESELKLVLEILGCVPSRFHQMVENEMKTAGSTTVDPASAADAGSKLGLPPLASFRLRAFAASCFQHRTDRRNGSVIPATTLDSARSEAMRAAEDCTREGLDLRAALEGCVSCDIGTVCDDGTLKCALLVGIGEPRQKQSAPAATQAA